MFSALDKYVYLIIMCKTILWECNQKVMICLVSMYV